MVRLNKKFAQRMTSTVGIAAIASIVALPSFAEGDRGQNVDRNYDRSNTEPVEQVNPNSDRSNDQRVSPTAANRDAASSLDQEFARLAYQGNNAEIQLSQLALERSQNPEVREFAQQMIREHTQANELLTNYLEQRDIGLPDEPVDPLNLAIAEQLSQLSGAAFDQAYMNAQTNAHLRSIALYQTQLDQGNEQGLRSYAAQLLPGIQNHYQMASEMAPNRTAEEIRPDMNMPQRVQ